MQAEIPYRPLGLIKQLLETHGFSVTHCYEDLVFIEHNAFLLQMGNKGADVSLVFNVDCTPDMKIKIEQALVAAGQESGLNIKAEGSYRLTPNPENDTLDIEFLTPQA
jgi:hypothetical protein